MRISKSAVLLSAVLVATSVTGTSASAASLADIPNLEIGAVGWNWPGADKPWNRNAERVDVKNTSTEAVNVKGLIVEDSWRHGQPDSYTGPCNRFTVTSVPQADGSTAETLPAGHTLRVYVGAGTPKVMAGTRHDVFMDSPAKCGYNGHIFNNGPGSSKQAPWETVWVKLGANTESKSYNYSFGYWVQ
ncbi:hypothetical protein AB0F17_15960 [Nonomuraea sp. NPDC026600]|uniref:hypothetical protein n=1 Tax=Nonomuraea sp. NPDC026600 TaxID=3155363 RepID=UPI0033FC4B72